MTDQLSVIVAGLSVIALKRLKRLLRVWGLEENEDYGEEKMDVMMVTARAPVNIAIIKYCTILSVKKGRKGSIVVVDAKLVAKEKRSAQRQEWMPNRKCRMEDMKRTDKEIAELISSSSSTDTEEDASCKGDRVTSDGAFGSSLSQTSSKRKRGITNIITPKLAAAFDRTKLSDCKATFVIAETMKSLCHGIDDITLNRDTIRRRRIEHRTQQATALQDKFQTAYTFLTVDTDLWKDREDYQKAAESLHAIKVVNDHVECMVAFIQEFSGLMTHNELQLQYLLEQDMENPRLQNCLREIRRRARKRKTYDDDSKDDHHLNFHVHICSCNNFPTAAGLASSAAGYACLVYALGKLFKVEADLSEIASYLKVNDQKKHTSSTQGMGSSVITSDLLKYRAAHIVPHRIKEITNAILEKNFQKFAEITMKDSNQFHAICMDTYPPLRYVNAVSLAIMDLVHSYNAFYGVNKIAYTFDAGPNACLFMLEQNVSDVAALIKHFFPSNVDNSKFFIGLPVMPLEHLSETLINSMQISPIHRGLQYVIHTQVGTGPELIEISSAHLLDDAGIPKQSTS
ncbi:uncharacterized protein LOC111633026 [Centruroides sculpturatus]|uniref:uncharacterized protein LOC111633026 n=1 Tax=Centruroides sculpturatus TaxID=218467 RepID=UPI000C6DD404|nr:uncharacterized protein LOC111633026 [Centruroides sculpturatus]